MGGCRALAVWLTLELRAGVNAGVCWVELDGPDVSGGGGAEVKPLPSAGAVGKCAALAPEEAVVAEEGERGKSPGERGLTGISRLSL